jgi:EF-hand domain pair
MPDLEAADIRALWKHFDANQDGVITKEEFRQFMTLSLKKQFNVELPLPSSLVDEGFRLLDTNNGGQVDFDEFKSNINRYWSMRQQIVEKYYIRKPDGSMARKDAAPQPAPKAPAAPAQPVPLVVQSKPIPDPNIDILKQEITSLQKQ